MRAAGGRIAELDRVDTATVQPVVEFVGLGFNPIDQARTIELIERRSSSAPFAYVVTPNVDHVVRLHDRPDLQSLYRNAWLTLCDSRILQKLAAFCGLRLPVVAGSDLTETLFRDVLSPEDRIAVLGGSDAIVDALRDRFGLTDLVHVNPPMGFANDPDELQRAVDFVIDAGARYTFLAVGSPQQERVADAVARSGRGRGIGLCIGASLEFLTAGKARAPRFMQALSLEWLFRLMCEPARLWRRYLVEGPRIFGIVMAWRRAGR